MPASTDDLAFKRILMYLLVGTRGGGSRIQIINLLRAETMNSNKMAERLGLDYKTVRHHLKILQENNIVVSSPRGSYAALYFLSPYLEKNIRLALRDSLSSGGEKELTVIVEPGEHAL